MENLGLIPGLGRYLAERKGYSLQYSCLENSMERGTRWATTWGRKELDTAEGLSLNGTQWTLCMLWYRSDLVPRRSMSSPLQKISLWHQHWPPKWFFSYKIRQSFHTLKHVVCSEMNTIFRSQYLRVPYQRIWRHPQILPSLILVETGVCVGASTLILVL